MEDDGSGGDGISGITKGDGAAGGKKGKKGDKKKKKKKKDDIGAVTAFGPTTNRDNDEDVAEFMELCENCN